MSARSKAIVGVLVAGTAGVIGICQVWLPFYSQAGQTRAAAQRERAGMAGPSSSAAPAKTPRDAIAAGLEEARRKKARRLAAESKAAER
jgi:hypothetical protein